MAPNSKPRMSQVLIGLLIGSLTSLPSCKQRTSENSQSQFKSATQKYQTWFEEVPTTETNGRVKIAFQEYSMPESDSPKYKIMSPILESVESNDLSGGIVNNTLTIYSGKNTQIFEFTFDPNEPKEKESKRLESEINNFVSSDNLNTNLAYKFMAYKTLQNGQTGEGSNLLGFGIFLLAGAALFFTVVALCENGYDPLSLCPD